MRTLPQPRSDVFDVYWRFAFERQRLFERRVRGEEPPWTADSILRTFKFCNVFRAADRVSQYLIREVAYHKEPCSVADRIFQIVAFRMFSKVSTWRSLREFFGRQPIIEDLRSNALAEGLDAARKQNGTLYTGAFILCATDAYGMRLKHLNHVELFRHMFLRERVAGRILDVASLQAVFDILHGFPLLGDFMSYQIAIDLNYAAALSFSENDFTVAGPGALRGIRKAFVTLGDYTPQEIIMWMVEGQDREFQARGFSFNGLWGRPLHAIDCQGLFCEVDKYCREALPALRSARTRIKARFSPSQEGLRLFFPPKWGINDKLPARAVLGTRRPEDGQPPLGFSSGQEEIGLRH